MQFTINGGRTLSGNIRVSGAKNAALKFMAAALLSKETWTLENVPEIADVHNLADLLRAIGADVQHPHENTYVINAKEVQTSELPADLSAKLRSSILCVAPLLARFGEVRFSFPGGCVLGKRPIDLFLDGYRALGAKVEEKDDVFHISAKKIQGGEFTFPWISHTGTESLILGAVMAQGTTKIINAAMEPEVASLCEWLNSLGAKIENVGHHTLTIHGVDSLGGGKTRIMPDRIETGTFAVLGNLIGEEIAITDTQPEDLATFWTMLKRAGGNYEINDSTVLVHKAKHLQALELRTREHPGFNTDLQPPFTVLLTQASGMSLVQEVIYEGRLFYTDILNRMGAKIIMADPHRVVVEGPTPLVAKKMESPDIRAGMALVIAALIAKGKSVIDNVQQVDRGYERIDQRLRELGAQIERVE